MYPVTSYIKCFPINSDNRHQSMILKYRRYFDFGYGRLSFEYLMCILLILRDFFGQEIAWIEWKLLRQLFYLPLSYPLYFFLFSDEAVVVGTSVQEEEVDLYKYQPIEQDWPFESLDEMTERIAQGNFKMD